MTYIRPKGSPTSEVWVVVEKPYPQDIDKGYVFSAGYGFIFDKMMQEAGFRDYYVCSRVPDPEHPDSYHVVESALNQYKPPFVIPLGNTLGFLVPEAKKKSNTNINQSEQEQGSALGKYCGSLLTSDKLKYPHYICSTFPPDYIAIDWSERDISVSLDLGKLKDEYDYWKKNGYLQPLPQRSFDYDFTGASGFDKLISALERYSTYPILSTDLETIYPRGKSKWLLHPGLPIVIGLAPSSQEGISFELFRESPAETVHLWKLLFKLLKEHHLLGQNFFGFDVQRLEILGFRIPKEHIIDTLLRHQILWPELPHKLQFLTRQYTREPYYKDEGHGWSPKDLKRLKRYNCLDVAVTFEVYDKQEVEFDERPHLR